MIEKTALLIVDPYNDFISDAESSGLMARRWRSGSG
jgi:hypothetical protein